MLKLSDFEVNKTVLLISVLRKYTKSKLGEKIKDRVFETLKSSPKDLNTLVKVCKDFTNHPDEYKVLLRDSTFVDSLKTIFVSDEFLELYNGAIKYKEELQERWNLQKTKVYNYFADVLGINEEKQIKVNVVNPEFNTGTNNLKNDIYWGHYKGQIDPYYDVIYMMHESMHCIYPYKKEWNSRQIAICHALIELATDNELRYVLEGNIKDYSNGHQDNNMQRNKLLPLWCAFLGKSESTILPLKNIEGADFSNYSILLENKKNNKMNFSQLMDYCIENYNSLGIPDKKEEEIEI